MFADVHPGAWRRENGDSQCRRVRLCSNSVAWVGVTVGVSVECSDQIEVTCSSVIKARIGGDWGLLPQEAQAT
jgi:hypothetical protein